MKIVAVTAYPTDIAHTYMATDTLIKSAHKFNLQIKVETQGAMGIENKLTPSDINQADKVLIVSNIKIDEFARFAVKNIIHVSIEDVLLDVEKVSLIHCRNR